MCSSDLGVIRWNGGVSFPIQAGHGCIGCSESNFWDQGPFYERLAKFPGFGIEATADQAGAIAGAVTAAGIAGHALLTNIRKRAEIGEHPGESAELAPPSAAHEADQPKE